MLKFKKHIVKEEPSLRVTLDDFIAELFASPNMAGSNTDEPTTMMVGEELMAEYLIHFRNTRNRNA